MYHKPMLAIVCVSALLLWACKSSSRTHGDCLESISGTAVEVEEIVLPAPCVSGQTAEVTSAEAFEDAFGCDWNAVMESGAVEVDWQTERLASIDFGERLSPPRLEGAFEQDGALMILFSEPATCAGGARPPPVTVVLKLPKGLPYTITNCGYGECKTQTPIP